jgi:hypothetical protein
MFIQRYQKEVAYTELTSHRPLLTSQCIGIDPDVRSHTLEW